MTGARQRMTGVAAFAAVLVFFFYATCKFRFAQLISFDGDASIIFQMSASIAEAGRYIAQTSLGNFSQIFLYPPPSIVIFATLARLGESAFIVLWVISMFAALCASVRLCVGSEREAIRRLWPVLLLLAILLVFNPVVYDLSNKNDNLIILAITMTSFATLKARPVVSGLALALAISLKLYSGVLLLWMIFFDRRAAISCIIALVALWGVMPALYFGSSGLIEIYRSWFDQVAIANGTWLYPALKGITGPSGPPLIPLRLALSTITGADANSAETRSLLILAQFTWFACLAFYAYRAWWPGQTGERPRSILADWSVLLLAPLPFSPWLEVYHAVALMVPCVVCLLAASDQSLGKPVRVAAVGACIGIVAVVKAPAPFEIRGLIYLVQFMVMAGALSFVRPAFIEDGGPLRVQQMAIDPIGP